MSTRSLFLPHRPEAAANAVTKLYSFDDDGSIQENNPEHKRALRSKTKNEGAVPENNKGTYKIHATQTGV